MKDHVATNFGGGKARETSYNNNTASITEFEGKRNQSFIFVVSALLHSQSRLMPQRLSTSDIVPHCTRDECNDYTGYNEKYP